MHASSIILIILVLGVTVLGFAASRWRGNGGLTSMDEWALGGRSFGTIISWFLIGGDLYTAYTFIAVPALAYAAGPIAFFALPYTIVAYPFGILVLTRFWSVARTRGYITAADFVRDRFGDRWLELAVAITGVVAVLPYIALQLVGMKVVFLQLGGVFAAGNGLLALTISFVLLAAYTYTSGLRAPAMIAFIKDGLIYLTIICAIFAVTHLFGGWHGIFDAAGKALAARPKPATLLLPQAGLLRVRIARVRIGAGALHLSALDYVAALSQEQTGRPAEHGASCRSTRCCSGSSRCWDTRVSRPVSK